MPWKLRAACFSESPGYCAELLFSSGIGVSILAAESRVLSPAALPRLKISVERSRNSS